LPDGQRQAVLMKIYGGMTFAEIAEVTGEPLQTIASRYRRALVRLQETCGRWL
jgi:RNA polymerase sigma-70 factor (ECF subfamily)